jgi:hypothetical protein
LVTCRDVGHRRLIELGMANDFHRSHNQHEDGEV